MFSLEDHAAVDRLDDYLRDVGYGLAWQRFVADRVPGGATSLQPSFSVVHELIKDLVEPYRFLLTLFAEGHSVEARYLRRVVPNPVVEACTAIGLLIPDDRGSWRTSDVAILPFQGLLTVVGLPVTYPTCRKPNPRTRVEPGSIWLIDALPPMLTGALVLDVGARIGLHSLAAACRGARRVVAIEDDPIAANIAGLNCLLNKAADRVEIQQSTWVEGQHAEGTFDFVLSELPSVFAPEVVLAPVTSGLDRCDHFERGLDLAARCLAAGGEGIFAGLSVGSVQEPALNRSIERSTGSLPLSVTTFLLGDESLDTYCNRSLEPALAEWAPEATSTERNHMLARWRGELMTGPGAPEAIHAAVAYVRRSSAEPAHEIRRLQRRRGLDGLFGTAVASRRPALLRDTESAHA